jgi:hypothetical protein
MAANPLETLKEYLLAFATLDPAVFASYYNLPVIFIAPTGVAAATDGATARQLAESFAAQLRQQRYKRTEFLGSVDCQMLSSTQALLNGIFRRIDSTDQVISDLGFTYLMHKTDDRWKIAVLTTYPPRALMDKTN